MTAEAEGGRGGVGMWRLDYGGEIEGDGHGRG